MDEPQQPKTAIWVVAVTIITSLYTYWHSQTSLVSSRPHFQGIPESYTIGDQQFAARLWQDPLLDGSNSVDSIGQLADQIKRKTNGAEVEVIGVMIGSSPYPEDVEERLRTRYAVESAFFAQDFTLSDSDHLGLAKMSWPKSAYLFDETNCFGKKANDYLKGLQASQKAVGLLNYNVQMFEHLDAPESADTRQARLLIPYEWAEKDEKNRTNNVLILWLEEEQFYDSPLTRLSILMSNLDLPKTLACTNKFKLIGPQFSDTLQTMLKDRVLTNKDNILSNHLEIFSIATAPDVTMLSSNKSPPISNCRERVSKEFECNLGSNSFTNFILTDDVVAWNMVNELELRQIDR